MKRSREPEDYLDSDFPPPDQDDAALRPVSKYTELDPEPSQSSRGPDATAMRCSLPPHKEPLSFNSYDEYESHYQKFHAHRCLECRKNFPSEHLLGIHIEECHDPLVVVKRDRGEHTYSCFVEGCERKCMTHQKRRMHMIDKHMYPKNFFFAVTKEGIDGRRSLLVERGHGHGRRRSSTATQSKGIQRRDSVQEPPTSPQQARKSEPKAVEAEGKTNSKPPEKADVEMENLTGAMSSLQFVPHNIRFGRGRPGFAKS